VLSLAPLKYRNVIARDGSPLERLQIHTGPCPPASGGGAQNHASAYLRPDLFPSGYRRNLLSFAAPDGVGSHASRQIACHMAISEAIERWALHHLRAHGVTDRYGLDLDPSSNGFAAFPGLTSLPARRKAMAEAVERHCLLCWWEGLLDYHPLVDPAPGVKAIRLENPFGKDTVAVVWGPHRGIHTTYGFGIGKDAAGACRRSLVERDRCGAIIDHHLEGRRNASLRDRDVAAVEDPYERRILYFSGPQGFRLFHERLRRGGAMSARRGGEPRPYETRTTVGPGLEPAPHPSRRHARRGGEPRPYETRTTVGPGLEPAPDPSQRPARRGGEPRPYDEPAEPEPPKAQLHFDGKIPGPWSRYATVWRTVLVPPTRRHLGEDVDCFFW
jgi:hypothetical protein